MITAGTSAAIDHLAMRFAREGRILLTESLTYDLGRRIFTGWGVRTVAVPGPVDDLDVDQFRKAAEQAARSARTSPVIYLIPTFHNPTSRVLSAERRLEIVAMAQETDSLIVEDHAYSDLGYESSPPPPPLWNYGTDTDQVISLYSLSKCLAPGLRIGWLLSSECLVSELAECPVRASGGGPNHFAAMVVMAGLAGNQMDSHINILRDQMRMRRDSLIMPLMRHLPESCTLSWPTGGFFAWVSLPNTVSDVTLLRDANRRGISFAAGNRFGVSPRGVRLCFARYKPEQLAFGAARFTDACRSAVRND